MDTKNLLGAAATVAAFGFTGVGCLALCEAEDLGTKAAGRCFRAAALCAAAAASLWFA